MGRSRYKITQDSQPHFMTLTILHWLPLFTRPETVQILLDSLRYLMRESFTVYAYVILENHMHLVARSEQLNTDIARFKSFTSRKLIADLQSRNAKSLLDQFQFYKKAHKNDRTYQLWQEGVHPELIQGEEMMRQKVDYIHQNPVKRGYVDKAEYWRYSSARDYVGTAGLLKISKQW